MNNINLIDKRVHQYYWDYDFNCAITMLKILAEIYEVEILKQTYDAVIGIPGAGRYGAQCGLIGGAIMFIGIYGRMRNIPDENIIKSCYIFTDSFKKKFGYLNCSELRPEGFRPENPPHLCEDFTKKAVGFTVDYIKRIILF
jgi:C_GCAxxG_C_C family probable redox protein